MRPGESTLRVKAGRAQTSGRRRAAKAQLIFERYPLLIFLSLHTIALVHTVTLLATMTSNSELDVQ